MCYLCGKFVKLVIFLEVMKTAPVKGKVKRVVGYGIDQEVKDMKGAVDAGFRCLFPGPDNGKLGAVDTDDIKALLLQPDRDVAGAAADIERPTGRDRYLLHSVDQIIVGPMDLPRRIAGLIAFLKGHGTFRFEVAG